MSLRGRLILTLVVLAGFGLLVLGAVTYAALRSYEVDRIDQRATAAVDQADIQLHRNDVDDVLGRRPSGDADDRHRPAGPPGGIGLAPSGTYAEQRDASGAVMAHTVLGLPAGDDEPAAPKLPTTLRIGDRRTVGATGQSDLRYRVYATQTPGNPADMTVVAVPFTEIDATLNRLLVIEAFVIAAVLLALAAAAWWLVRLGLRPLDRIGATAGAIAAGDLSHRVERARAADGGRPPRALAQRDARAPRGGVRRAPRERGAPAPLPRRRLARAAHAAVVDPRLRRAVPDRRRPRGPGRREGDEPHRGRVGADGRARRGPPGARAPGRDPRRAPRARRPRRARRRRRRRRARRRRPTATIELLGGANGDAVVDGDPDQLRQVLANLVRNALVHTPAGTPIEVSIATAGRRRRHSRSATTGRGCRRTTRASSSTASGARTRRAGAGVPAPASAWRSSPRSSTRTAGGPRPPTPRAAGRASPSCCRCSPTATDARVARTPRRGRLGCRAWGWP